MNFTLVRAALLSTSLLGVGCLRLEEPPPFVENGEHCDFDSQCDPGSQCMYQSSSSDYVCWVRGGCLSHEGCGPGLACVAGLCSVAGCTQSATCGAYACDQAFLACFDSCAGDGECNTGYVCRDGECSSATCSEATAASVCHGSACSAGVCQDGFNCDYYGCASGYTCSNYQCVRPCSGDSACERYTCDTSSGRCRESCFSLTDCQPGYTCEDYFCQVP